ncbi:MAG: Lrp/AsnC family transcriptional regulator [Cyanobacteria bacterium J06621_11]
MNVDELDRKLLTALMMNGRVKWTALADEFGVSAPAIADRVRRLEREGLITGYAAQVNAEALGFDLTAFVTVTLAHPQHRQAFLAYVQATGTIQACHHIVGEGDYLLKVRCRSTAELEHLLSEELKGIDGVVQTRTTIALRTVEETTVLPLEPISLDPIPLDPNK